MKKYGLIITHYAKFDLFIITDYLHQHMSKQFAIKKKHSIKKAIMSLDVSPERGHVPHDILIHGGRILREIHIQHYRIIYVIEESEVIVYGILDDRRDIQELLKERLKRE